MELNTSEISLTSDNMNTKMDILIVKEEKEETPQPRIPLSKYTHALEHITTTSHFAIIGVSVYLIYICFLAGFRLFTWHPFLFAVGWMLFMTEAILMITKENIFTTRMNHKLRVRWHWVLQVLGAAMYLVGFIAVVIVEENLDQPHFTTLHGLSGLISIIFSIPAILSGVLALFNFEVRKYISPKLNKITHAIVGIVTVVVGGVAMVSSLYTNWFQFYIDKHKDVFIICYILIVFGIVWSLLRPITTCWFRLKTLKF